MSHFSSGSVRFLFGHVSPDDTNLFGHVSPDDTDLFGHVFLDDTMPKSFRANDLNKHVPSLGRCLIQIFFLFEARKLIARTKELPRHGAEI